jgi:hypothetical protein
LWFLHRNLLARSMPSSCDGPVTTAQLVREAEPGAARHRHPDEQHASASTETLPSVVHPDCFGRMTGLGLDGFDRPDLGQIATVERAQISSTVLRQIGRSEIRC